VLVLAAAAGARALGLPIAWAVLGTLAWAPAAAGVVSGQNTSLALALVVLAGVALARGADGIAGGAAGLLAYKPQLAVPVAGLLALRQRWRGLAAAVLVVLVQYAAGVVATGGDARWPMGWLDTVATYTHADFVANGWQAISLPALGTYLGTVTGLPGLTLAGYVAALAIVLLCIPALRRAPAVDAVALACACGLVASPHAWVYDATLLLPALAVLAVRAARNGKSRNT